MQNLKSILESILFASGEQITIDKLAKTVNKSNEEVEKSLKELELEYEERKSGIVLIRYKDKIQLTTRPENSPYVEQLYKSELQGSLSAASLEVLSIIAYRGPISKAQIEAIRGVNCSYTLRNLLMRGLIEKMTGDKEVRGITYILTIDLLKKLGIDKVEKLPEYDKLSKDERLVNISEN